MSHPAIWNFWARRYHKLWVQKWSLAPTRRAIIDYLKGHYNNQHKINLLDMGCGTGQLVGDIKRQLVDYSFDIVAVDYAPKMVDVAQENYPDVDFVCSDAKDYKCADKSFDVIICTHSFPYYHDQRQVLKKFNRLLLDDGTLLLAQASAHHLYDRFVMRLVKLTTGRAHYPSPAQIEQLSNGLFKLQAVHPVKTKFFMPALYLFILKKGS